MTKYKYQVLLSYLHNASNKLLPLNLAPDRYFENKKKLFDWIDDEMKKNGTKIYKVLQIFILDQKELEELTL